MSIYDDVNTQLKDAMKSRDQARLAALRGIRAGIIVAMKETGADRLDDARCLEVLRGLAKQRRDSIDAYAKGGRQDLVDQESAELAVIETFLPSLAGEDQTRAWVAEAIAATGATSERELGRVMGALMKAHKGDLDAGLANRLVRELLAG